MSLHPDVERLALLGWRLHPAWPGGSRASCIKNAAALASFDLDQLDQWSREFPGCNWRVVMAGSGIWSLDVDAPGPDHGADGIKAMADLVATHGPLPPRPATRSGGGGYALFFRHHGEAIVGASGTPAPGLDPLRGRQTVTVPPSIHHRTRRTYRWIVAPWEVSAPPAPAWLLRLVAPPPEPPIPVQRPLAQSPDQERRFAEAALRGAANKVATAPPGRRNDILNWAAWTVSRFMTDGTLHSSEIAEQLAAAGRIAGLDRIEVRNTLRSALAAGARR
jgi:hypothetical protein